MSTFIAREGIHITLTAEAHKLHVQMSVEEVKGGGNVNKVAMLRQTASTDFGEMEKYGVKDGDMHSLPPSVVGERRNHGCFHVGQRCAQQHGCVMSRRTLHRAQGKAQVDSLE